MIKAYGITVAFLQGVLWLFVRRMAIDTHFYLLKIYDPDMHLPLLSELAYKITPYAWISPFGLLGFVIIRWKKDDRKAIHALGISTIIFLIYLAMCVIGFSTPFIPKMSEFIK